MELSLFLAKLFGFYFLIMGMLFLWRRKAIMPIFEEFAGSRALMVVIAIVEIFAGLALIVAHNIWNADYRVVITIIGYWMVVEGIIYLMIPKKEVKGIIKKFSHPSWYITGSLLAIVIGVYLLNAGYGI